jgi:hypothetical protein
MLNAIQHKCTRSYIWTMAALETGVEWKADEVCLLEPLRDTAGIRVIHSAYDIGKIKRMWTAVRSGSCLSRNERSHLKRIADEDVIGVDIKTRGKKMKRTVNIYDLRVWETDERSSEER